MSSSYFSLRSARTASLVLLLLSPYSLRAQQPSPNLQGTLERLNAAAARFTGAQATFKKDLYNSLVKDHTPQDGSIYVLRVRGATQMGAKIDGPGARIVEYKNGLLRDFNPAIKCFDAVSASGNQSRIETFLTLGFGGSGRDLAKSWTVSDLGPEQLDDEGKPIHVEKLDLVPKEQSVRNLVTHVTLWVDLDRDVSLKQEFYSPSGDIQTAYYSRIKLTDKPDTKPFVIKGSACGK